MARQFHRAGCAALLAAALGATAVALIFSGAAAADPPPGGTPAGPSTAADPPLTSFASVPLSTSSGPIQAVIYDGANTEVSASGGTLPLTLSGFTVPGAPFGAQTTAVVADGQVAGNSFSFAGSGPAFTDPAAFPGTGPCPSGWSFGCLWDNNNYDVTSTLNAGDTSANASVITSGTDCVTWVAQAFATGSSAAFSNAGYAASGVGLRDQGSGTINISGIPGGANWIARAYLFWAIINNNVDPGGAMMINGHSVAGNLDATDVSPCWPLVSPPTIYSFSANVTPFVTGNGAYTLSGYPTGLTGGQDPWASGNDTAYPLIEGASLVVFYGQASATGTPISSVEGAPFSGAVATFTQPDASAPASQFSATIDWGDGTSAGTVTGPVGGPFTVSGSHTYIEEGSYPVKVTITDNVNSSNEATATSTATVADAPLTASCATPTVSTASFSGPVATFTDANPFAPVSDFTATIDWGDSSISPGVVTGPTGGPFTVSGSHTYATLGNHTIMVSIVDEGGSTATAGPCTVLIYTPVPFVIGDGNSAVGTDVTFWGAQWWKLNTLSGGAAPASFKGFALEPSTPSCGTNWTTGPGNSPPPPAGPLPSFIGVIVASSISQSGSQISGDTVQMVVVETNPGYSSNPGHAGTGTVVAQIC
jgi:PKD domain